MKWWRVVQAAACLVGMILIVYAGVAYNHGAPLFFREEVGQASSWPRAIGLAICMIVGIVCGQLYLRLASLPDLKKVNIRQIAKATFSQAGLFRSLLGSPLLFVVVYSVSGRQPDLLLASVFAFENGFFCHLLLKTREPFRKIDDAQPEASR